MLSRQQISLYNFHSMRVTRLILSFLQVRSSYQVIPNHGNPQMRRTLFDGYLFEYCSVKYHTFHQENEKSPANILAKTNHLKSFLDPSESHKTSSNLSDRAYFRQFSDW